MTLLVLPNALYMPATVPLPTDSSAYTHYIRTYRYDSAGNLTQIRYSAPATGNTYTTNITLSDRSKQDVFSTLTENAAGAEVLGSKDSYSRRCCSAFNQAPLIHLDWGNEGRFLPDWRSWLQARGTGEPAPQPAFTFNLTSLAIDAAVAGAGLLLGQRRLIAAELARGDLVIADSYSLPLSKPYYLVWPQRTLQQPDARALIAWLTALAAA